MGFFTSSPPAEARATRPFRMVAAIGGPGNGKSSLVVEWVDAWLRERKGRGQLAFLDPGKQFRHLGPNVATWPGEMDPKDERSPEERAETWIRTLRVARHPATTADPPPCMVGLDDADTYMNSGSPRGVWRDFLMRFRHWRCDVVVTARRPQEIPKVIFQNLSVVALFASTEPGSREYIVRWLGPALAAQIPTEPHRYLLVDVAKRTGVLMSTKKRPFMTAADRA